jgi:hypothetical protein
LSFVHPTTLGNDASENIPVHVSTEGRTITAVIDFGSADVTDEIGETEEERDRGNRVFALHFMTPVNEHQTIDRWMHLRNTAVDTEEASDRIDAMLRIAFAEDKAILEAVQHEERHPQLPDVPTFKELGHDVVTGDFVMIVGPKGLPEDVKAKLVEGLMAVATSEGFTAAAISNGMVPNPATDDVAAEKLTAQVETV